VTYKIPSFRGARSASPESITTTGSMDSGPAQVAHPGMTKAIRNNIRENHMPIILGSDEHRYRVIENWAKLPDG